MIYRFNDCIFDVGRHELTCGGRRIDAEPKVQQVLAYLIENRSRLVTRDELLDHCWAGLVVSDGTLTRCLSRVRQAIGQSRSEQQPIQTVHSRGYRFVGVLQSADQETSSSVSSGQLSILPSVSSVSTVSPAPSRSFTTLPEEFPSPTELTLQPTEALMPSLAIKTKTEQTPIPEPPLVQISRQPTAERRHLTLFSCELTDVQALMERLDPEDLHSLMQAFRMASTEIIEGLEGMILRYHDNGFMACFGYPRVHEDDALRAVRAGLQLVDRLFGQGLSVQVGIHSGLVIIEPPQEPAGGHSPSSPLAVGTVPTVVAELCRLASAQSVLISAATARLVQGHVEQQAFGEYVLSGNAPPIALFRITGLKADQTRLGATASRGLTPYAGRLAEKALLQERWSQSCIGMGQTVLISGEAGIGKSRLVQEFKETLDDTSYSLLEIHGTPYHQNTAFHSLSEMWRRWLGWQPNDPDSVKLASLQNWLHGRDYPWHETLQLLADLLELELPPDQLPRLKTSARRTPEASAALRFLSSHDTPQTRRQRIFEGMLALVLEESAQKPLLFIVEDLHWTDPSTLGFLELLISQIATLPIMVVLTCRPDDQPYWAAQNALTPLMLKRLPPAQVPNLISHATSGKSLPPELLQWLVEKTDGVPLFIEELTRMVLESNQVREAKDRYELIGPLEQLGIPGTLHDLLVARLDRLRVGKEIAQWGAVIGRTFSHALLAAVVPFDETQIQQGLNELLAAGLIFQRGLATRAHYIFKHTLVHDAVYFTLLKSRRHQLHQRVAQILERNFPDLAAAEPGQLALHYTAAEQPDKAIAYWQRAGESALRRYAMPEALRHFQQGLQLLPVLPANEDRDRQELALQAAIAPVYTALQGSAAQDVEAAYSRTYELSQKLGETEVSLGALWGLWRFYLNCQQLRRAGELSEQMLNLAQDTDDKKQLLIAHVASQVTAWLTGNLNTARAHSKSVRTYYDPARHVDMTALCSGLDPVVLSMLNEALVLWGLGFPDQSIQKSLEVMALAHESAHPYTLVFAFNFTNMLLVRRRELSKIQQGAEQQIDLATEYGFDSWLINGKIYLAWAQTMLGQTQKNTAEQIQHNLDIRQAMGGGNTLSFWLSTLADVYIHFNEYTAAQRVLVKALRVTKPAVGGCEWAAELYRLQGLTLFHQRPDKFHEAEVSFQQALAVARQQKAKMLELRAATQLARLYQTQGKFNQAYALLAPVYEWFREGFDLADLQDAKWVLAQQV